MDVCHSADQLGEDFLDLGWLERAGLEKVIVQLIARAVLQYQPDQSFRDYDLIQPCDVRVKELAVMVDFAGEIGVILFGRLENNLGAISELVGC